MNQLIELAKDFELKVDNIYEKISDLSDVALDFISELDSKETNRKNKLILEMRINDLNSNLNLFLSKLTLDDNTVPKDLIEEKNKTLSLYDRERQALVVETCDSEESIKLKLKELESNLVTAKTKFQSWKENSIKNNYFERSTSSISDESNIYEAPKHPRFKLESLSLPKFSGNVRLFPKFLKEFEITVGVQYHNDPDLKLMILQNQCLSGLPRDLVNNLTAFDEAMSRLKNHYGRPSLIIESILKELKDFKLSSNESFNIIKLDTLLQSAEDDLNIVNFSEEFNNVVVIKLIESKLSLKLQELWAEKKSEIEDSKSNTIMKELKSFIKNRSKVAQSMKNIGSSNAKQETIKLNCNVTEIKKILF